MDDKQLSEILDFAVESAQLAGAFTLGYFNAQTPVEIKADRTPVTAADRGAEERLRARIEKAFPTHGILGEEFGEKPGREPIRWILDPIDGTFSFICGVPAYSVLIGVEVEGRAVAGVIHMPALNETVYAARGLGCRWNGRVARVSQVAELENARMFNAPLKLMKRHGRQGSYAALADATMADRGCLDGYAYALLATGRAEIVLDPIMNLWDTAALYPCVTEAGGTLTDWDGNDTHTAPEAVGTNGLLLPAVLREIRDGTVPY
ncbi:MAG: inositol monophosphatase family protein [Phycisphaerae bacterium]